VTTGCKDIAKILNIVWWSIFFEPFCILTIYWQIYWLYWLT